MKIQFNNIKIIDHPVYSDCKIQHLQTSSLENTTKRLNIHKNNPIELRQQYLLKYRSQFSSSILVQLLRRIYKIKHDSASLNYMTKLQLYDVVTM
jgi:hypothetical protein